ncbi:hypothetical protein [Vibrio rumoiensis]|uniref:Capsular biosynthesis protein n=1 Tax=Vibrio rumoiensis 1S-45 TaxID=1188252 RepID=A0A1E5E630_9VIBR|nr:hypothetical protein [Vibrio rumoiensis]OEF29481.1 capsular biosynthesis protein [Vibrio rumoiensis 1S-45]
MFLIMSAAYIEQELRAEFGPLPPAFLPLGNRRLFQHQLKRVPKNKAIFLSIPQSYHVEEYDENWLKEHNVTLLPVPDDLSLGESIIAAIALASQPMDSELSILYGDTLLSIPEQKNVIAVANTDSAYNWASISSPVSSDCLSIDSNDLNLSSEIISGYFNFSSPRLLIQALSQNHWDFLSALSTYNENVKLSTIQIHDWMDFGHVNTYYQSKTKFTTQRAFNHLKINSDWIEKSSAHDIKIQAEANWFKEIPYSIKHFTPQFLGNTETHSNYSYRLEYLFQCALNELFVFARLPEMVWGQIFKQLSLFIEECRKVSPPKNSKVDSINALFINKTNERLATFCRARKYDNKALWHFNQCEPVSLEQLVSESTKRLPSHSEASIMHGDFCFSNILYDFRKNKIKTIDPRGITTQGDMSIYGYIHYDIAKISHSVLGLYDWIIAGYYQVDLDNYKINFNLPNTQHLETVQAIFLDTLNIDYQLSESEIYAMQVQLFLSMLPLHSDDPMRQNALLANAFRLYYKMLETEL